MIWCLLAHLVATPAVRLRRRALLNQSCWLDTVNDELASLFIIDGALLGNYPWKKVARGAALHLVSGFCFFIILTGSDNGYTFFHHYCRRVTNLHINILSIIYLFLF